MGGRLFAMMAVRGLDMLWTLCFFPLMSFDYFVAGSPSGTYRFVLGMGFMPVIQKLKKARLSEVDQCS